MTEMIEGPSKVSRAEKFSCYSSPGVWNDTSNAMKRNQIAWYLWAIGTVLVVMSWTGGVPVSVGWFGFALGLVGSAISWGLRPPSDD